MTETESYISGSDRVKDDSLKDYTVVNLERSFVGKAPTMKIIEGGTKTQENTEERKRDEKWKLPEIERFLKLYEMHPCLWDYKLPEYKDKNVREHSWEEIVNHMNKNDFTAQKAKDKIRVLRNTYSNELIKIHKSKTSGVEQDDIYTPTLKWFCTMDRILGQVVQIRGSQPVGYSEKRSDTSRMQQEDIEKFKSTKIERADESLAPLSSSNSFAGRLRRLEREKQSRAHHQILPHLRSFTKRTAAERLNKIENAVQKMKGIISDVSTAENNSMEANCEFDLFGKFVSSQLKRLPEVEALGAMQQIQNCLLQKRISILDRGELQPKAT